MIFNLPTIYQDDNSPLIYVKLSDNLEYIIINPDLLREDEKSTAKNEDAFIVIDSRYKSKMNAVLSMCRTIFICTVLTLGALFFSKDANTLAVEPIERMIKNVKQLA